MSGVDAVGLLPVLLVTAVMVMILAVWLRRKVENDPPLSLALSLCVYLSLSVSLFVCLSLSPSLSTSLCICTFA